MRAVKFPGVLTTLGINAKVEIVHKGTAETNENKTTANTTK